MFDFKLLRNTLKIKIIYTILVNNNLNKIYAAGSCKARWSTNFLFDIITEPILKKLIVKPLRFEIILSLSI